MSTRIQQIFSVLFILLSGTLSTSAHSETVAAPKITGSTFITVFEGSDPFTEMYTITNEDPSFVYLIAGFGATIVGRFGDTSDTVTGLARDGGSCDENLKMLSKTSCTLGIKFTISSPLHVHDEFGTTNINILAVFRNSAPDVPIYVVSPSTILSVTVLVEDLLPMPEAGTWLMMVAGFGAVGALFRAQKRDGAHSAARVTHG